MRDLSLGDQRVRELCVGSGGPQSLVSYHLSRLRQAGLVSARRSSADGRDTYYVLDLKRCRELLSDAGRALHPGLVTPATGPTTRHRVEPVEVLFLCTGNSARSQIAQTVAGWLSGGTVRAVSAGSSPKPLHPNALLVMRGRGLPVGRLRPKHLSEFADRRFDYVITLCDRVREACPEFPGGARRLHWSLPDPAREPGNDEQTLPAFERLADELTVRIGFLLDAVAVSTTDSEVMPDGPR
jgi:ArsR family transcriptional regulator, arsenate/arsenite/antimonite-responsive transcriptional repressor / arsenate reductase (thioredoxin)